MNTTTAATTTTTTPPVPNAFAATIGLDWADDKHDVWLQPAEGGKPEHLRLEHTPEALHAWVAALGQRFSGRSVALGVETSRGPIISALLAYNSVVLFPINPKALKDYRAAFAVSGAKADRTDAQLLEELVRLHRNRLKAWKPDTELTRRLGGLVEVRRHLVDERTRKVNQLHSALKLYYPLADHLLGAQMNLPLAAEFLRRWPELASLKKASPKTLRAFFFKHNCRSAKIIKERLAAIEAAQPLTTDKAIIAPHRALVEALADMLRSLHRSLAQIDQAIKQAMDEHPDAALFRSFPGAGAALAPRLLAAFGADRERFASAQEVAQFFGLAPVVIQSGHSRTVRMRYRCPKFGRQSFHENAICARFKEPWAALYYREHRKRNDDKHHEACRALAFKLIRIMYACWKNRTPYNSELYLQALEKNGSPLHAQLQKAEHGSGE